MPVRSKRLVVATSVNNAESIVYTVSSGETTLLKHVFASVTSGTISRAVAFVNSGPRRVSLFDQSMSAFQVVNIELWLAMGPGDTLGLFSQGGTITLWASGAELEGVAD